MLVKGATCQSYYSFWVSADSELICRATAYIFMYRKTSNMRRTFVGNKMVDPSDVVRAAPVGAAPTTSSFSTLYLASMDLAKATARRDEKQLSFGI